MTGLIFGLAALVLRTEWSLKDWQLWAILMLMLLLELFIYFKYAV